MGLWERHGLQCGTGGMARTLPDSPGVRVFSGDPMWKLKRHFRPQEKFMSNDLDGFEQFMKLREKAARAYVNGDADPVDGISTQFSPATFFHPSGDYEQGAEQVSARYKRDSEYFESGGDTSFEILQMAASESIAYW